jgi:hypothetical protein
MHEEIKNKLNMGDAYHHSAHGILSIPPLAFKPKD